VHFAHRRHPLVGDSSYGGRLALPAGASQEAEGKRVKIYRQYSVFAPLIENGKKEFREQIATIDSRGFFIDIVEIEGTLDPLIIGLKRKQSWDTKTKIKPIVSPIK
jgi:hypothetical protein